MTDDTAIELGDMIRQVMMAVMEVRRAGSPGQLAAARRVLTETRRSMYRILAEDETDEPPAEPDTADTTVAETQGDATDSDAPEGAE
jgi:hypothetical protein